MKKKLSIILLLLTISLCSIVSIDRVWADKEYSTSVGYTGNGKTSTCKNGNCYTMGTGGIRIALVDANGQRVKNSKGELTNIVDLWYYGEGLDLVTFDGKIVIYQNNYRLRQNLPNYENISNDHIMLVDTRTLTSIDEVFDGILDGMSNAHDSDSETYTGQDEQLNVRIPNVTWEIMTRITNNANEDNSYLDKLYTKLNIKASEVKEEYFLQVEPLVQWGNYKLTDGEYTGANKYDSYKFLGTPSQLTLLFYGVNQNKISELCYGNSIGYVNELGNGSCKDSKGSGTRSAFNYINGYTSFKGSTNYYDFASVGIISTSEDSMPIKADGSPFFETVNNGDYIGEDTGYDLIIEDTTNSKAYGVGFISLVGKVDESNCHSQAYNIIKDNYSSKLQSKSGYYINKNREEINLDNAFCKSTNFENDKIKESCCVNGTISVSKCPQLTNGFLSNVGVIVTETQDDNNDLCAPITCGNTIASFDKDNNNITDGKINRIKSYLEEDTYKNIIDYFSEFNFGDGASKQGLSYTIWGELLKELFGGKAACGYTPPPCKPVNNSGAHCLTGGGTFTLSDSDKCIESGIAYNDVAIDGDSMNMMQTSYDAEYGTVDDPGTCREEVEFKFPTSISKDNPAIAGTVMKWGINTDKTNNQFGTMTVTRECNLSESAAGEIGSKWANVSSADYNIYYNTYDTNNSDEGYVSSSATGRIDPKFNLIYKYMKDGKIETIDGNLKVYLSSFKLEAKKTNDAPFDSDEIYYNEDGTMDVENTVEQSDGYRSMTCDGNCWNGSGVKKVKMVATYNIIYKEDLEWHADKSENGELITSSSDNFDSDSSSYVFAGYGVPASLTTPSNYNCITSDKEPGSEGGYLDSNIIAVEVKQVGTRNGPSNSESYHFDDYVKYLLDDDNNDNNALYTIDYICNYHIKNELFDEENNSSSPIVCDGDRTPKGIDVVFRTVDLVSDDSEVDNAFPGRSGLGERTKGANWDVYSNDEIAKLLDDSVYSQKDPMYSITLDSPTIQMIREWNNSARGKGIDPYTYMEEPKTSVKEDPEYGYTGYNYEDESVKVNNEDITYKFVKSRFLTMLSNRLDDDHYKSICVNGDTHILNCNQSWWEAEEDKKHSITITEENTVLEG